MVLDIGEGMVIGAIGAVAYRKLVQRRRIPRGRQLVMLIGKGAAYGAGIQAAAGLVGVDLGAMLPVQLPELPFIPPIELPQIGKG